MRKVSVLRGRNVSVVGLDGFEACLAWAVGTYDREFKDADTLTMEIERELVRDHTDTDEDGQPQPRWRPLWSASLCGTFEGQGPDGGGTMAVLR